MVGMGWKGLEGRANDVGRETAVVGGWYAGKMLRVTVQLLLRGHVSEIGRGKGDRVGWLLIPTSQGC